MNDIDDVTVVVLAGGRGTRLQGLYPNTPKPMIPALGKPFLHWVTVWFARHGTNQFIYSTGYMAESIEAWIAENNQSNFKRQCRREEEPLGTGGALLNCVDLCDKWILVTNGDSLVLQGLSELLALRYNDSVDGGLIGLIVEDASRYGTLVVAQNGQLLGFKEKIAGGGLINGGVYLFRKTLLAGFGKVVPSSIEFDIFPELLRRGANLRVVPVSDAPFIDIGTPETIARAEYFLKKNYDFFC